MITTRNIFYGFLFVSSINSTGVWADQSQEEIQKRFNQETISRPFSVADDATLTAALKEATERGIPTKLRSYYPGCFGLGCVLGYGYGYGSYFGGYARPYYGGHYGAGLYNPYYAGGW